MGLNDISYSQILQIKKGDNFELSNLYIKYSSYVNTERNINFKYIDDMLFKKMFKKEFKKFIDETNFVEIKDIFSHIRSNIKSICFNGVKNYIEYDNYTGLKEFISKINGSKLNALKELFNAIGFNGTHDVIKSILESDETLYLEIKQNVDSNMPINTYGDYVKLFFAVYLGDKTNIITQVVTSKQKSEKEEKEAIAKVMESEKILKERKVLERLDERTIDLYKYFDRRYTFKDLDSNISLLPNKKDIDLVYKCCGLLLDGKSSSEKSRKEYKDFKERVLPLLSEILRKNVSTKISAIDLLFVLENKYTYKEVVKAIDSLNKSVKDNIYLVCGEKLNGITKNMILEDDISYFWNTSLVVLKEFLINKKVKEKEKEVLKGTKPKSGHKGRPYEANLCKHFDFKYTKGQLRAAVMMCSSDVIQILFKKYGPYFDGVGVEEVTSEENELLRSKNILYTLKGRLENISKESIDIVYGVSIFTLFDEYSKDYILDNFNLIKGSTIHTIISDVCGENLEINIPDSLDDMKVYEFNYAIKKFKQVLVKGFKSNVSNTKKRKSTKSLFTYFDEYTQEEILAAFDGLGDDMKKIFCMKCGNNLDGIGGCSISVYEHKQMLLGISKMKTRLRKIRNPISTRKTRVCKLQSVNLIDRFNNKYTYQELCNYISMMTPYRQEIIYYVCGKNLDGKIDHELKASDKRNFAISHRLLKELITKLEENPNYSKKALKDRSNLYSYFDNKYSYEFIRSVVDNLGEGHKDIIYKKCGPLFDGLATEPLNEEEIYLFQSYSFTKLKGELEKKFIEYCLLDENYDFTKDSENVIGEYGVLGSILSNYDIDQIYESINKLNSTDRELLYRVYGEDLDSFNITKLSINEREEFVNSFNNLVDTLKTLFNGYTKRKYGITSLIQYFDYHYTKEQLEEVIDTLPLEEKELVIKRFGVNFDGDGAVRISSSENKHLMCTVMSRVDIALGNKYGIKYRKKKSNVKHGRIVTKEEILREEQLKKEALPKISVKVVPKGNTSYIPKLVKKTEEVITSSELVLEEVDDTNIGISVSELIKVEEPTNKQACYVYSKSDVKPLSFKEILEERKKISDSIMEEVPLDSDVPDDNASVKEIKEVEVVTMNNILTKKDCVEIKEIIESIDFTILESIGFTLEEQIVLALIHKKYNGKQDSILKIAEFLETDVSIVRDIGKSAINKYKDITNKELNNRIVSLKLGD